MNTFNTTCVHTNPFYIVLKLTSKPGCTTLNIPWTSLDQHLG